MTMLESDRIAFSFLLGWAVGCVVLVVTSVWRWEREARERHAELRKRY